MKFSEAFKPSKSPDPMDVDEWTTRTENGMKTNHNTESCVLDFFGKAGSSRGKDLTPDFTSALVENKELALRALQWTRDIREGAGERQQFRSIVKNLDKKHPKLAALMIPKIPELGRFDDLFAYENPANRKIAFNLIKKSLNEGNANCAKWMPRKGQNAVKLTKFLGLSPKEYRRLIVDLTKVVETKMCAKDWDNINFSHVPSVASARYQKAFGRNATEKYKTYLSELSKPDSKVKINAGAVYPYDVCKSVMKGNAEAADAQWKALPNYVGDAKILPMVDVSASMGGFGYGSRQGNGPSPMEVAVSLGLYLSEKNTSDFKDMFLTFSGEPEMQSVTGNLSSRINNIMRSNWGYNTNLHKAFDEILRVASIGKVSQEDMPEILLILSDMQFDECTYFDDSAQEMIKRKYKENGYEVPRIVFWNLNGTYGNNSPVKLDDRGVCHVSGFSPAIMKSVLADDLDDFTPYNVMLKTLNVERYDIDIE